ncbi:PREDICTED: putative L-type lectin-domain containing receptor kinase II.2 [Tarenaya hassleriana]|uniref:putative L-type lectin-domain containing receptor kinase II.2 n=1 Tax=Tarenaya hassleriana TaxID=28532 RepID=UPI00053C0D1E|nr:PREDICTED: putative L-type lectin-domain containing receptor kinase II.2 [Tarenaya hassleriana]
MEISLRSQIFWIIISAYFISSVFGQDGDQFVYYDFRKANLSIDGMATIFPSGILKLTNDSTQSTGHAFYNFPIEFNTSSSSSSQSLSFSTEFVFALIPEVESRGQGMAFVVSPSTDLRYGGPTSYLGLFNRSTDNKTENHILAVELDTNRSPEEDDISDNHVGIDVNSIVSIDSANASYFSYTEGKNESLVLASGLSTLIWIEYDDADKLLNVTLAPIPTQRFNASILSRTIKPSLPLLSKSINLSEIFLGKMFIGFSGSTGTIKSDQYILGWSFKKGGIAESLDLSKIPNLPPPSSPPPPPPSPPPPPPSPPPPTPVVTITVASISAVAFLMIVGAALYFYHKKKYEEVLEQWEKEYSPQRLSFRTLYKATKGFKESRLLGAGGFGKVYKGELPSGTQIAVKRVSHEAEQGMRQYVAEIVSMGRLRHKNLVQLLGYCRRKGELLLVYDYMPNGSLDDYLFNRENPQDLTWSQRFHIIKGVASALLYLHEEWEQVVLHRDIKASNVLLDSDLNGRLGDFGLARFHDRGTNLQVTRVVGTIGYMAPELTAMGLATTWTDVYAFGAFMLEVVCGRRPVDPERPPEQMILVKWVTSCWRRGDLLDTVDNKLEGNRVPEEVEMVLKLGLLCSQNTPENRPTMRQIIQYLEGNATVPDISFETAEIGIPSISIEAPTTMLTTTSSSANFSFDTVTVLFGGR